MPKERALSGSRTRVPCLEGKYPNRWTNNATPRAGPTGVVSARGEVPGAGLAPQGRPPALPSHKGM